MPALLETDSPPILPPVLAGWFAARGWQPRRHQIDMVREADAGHHALLVATTGAGKTLSGFLPTLIDLIEAPTEGLHTLYVSPLKALAVDIQRNLLGPIAEMALDIRVETRTGDTPSDRKARQRIRPPQILLTTPESLSLLLSYPDSVTMFAGLKTIVIDEVHAFATGKRGDLLSLGMARLQRIAPALRRVALSATVADPDGYRAWLAPDGDIDAVTLVRGEPGADPDIAILLPEGRVPWSGHSGRYAADQVMAEIETHRTTIVFCNTRSLCELIFQDLWKVNALSLPIGVHHGSLSLEARRKVEGAMAAGRLRALVATASLDLGVDWGDVDCVIQMGAPKGSSRLLQRLGRSNHRLDEASEGILVPGNRFEYLEARAALDAVEAGELDPDIFLMGSLDVLAQHVMACACAAPFDQAALLGEIRGALPYSALTDELFDRVLGFIRDGGYSLKAYDRFKRLTQDADGMWRISHPKFVDPAPPERRDHRRGDDADGAVQERPVARQGGGGVRRQPQPPATPSSSPGSAWRSRRSTPRIWSSARRASPARIPTYGGSRMALSTNLADRVRHFLAEPAAMGALPRRCPRMAGLSSSARSALPSIRAAIAGRDLSARGAALHGRLQLRGMERAPVAGHAA